MNFLDLVNKRRSVRKYTSQEVEQQKIDYILECARLAPSAVNFQPWRLSAVRDPETLAALQQCYPRSWFSTAPLCIVVSVDRSRSWKRPSDGRDHGDIDAAIIAEHICLAAADAGLGSCWICNFDTARFAELFALPEGVDPVVLIPIGYADDTPAPKHRLTVEEISLKL